jgi:hypothetical protein
MTLQRAAAAIILLVITCLILFTSTAVYLAEVGVPAFARDNLAHKVEKYCGNCEINIHQLKIDLLNGNAEISNANLIYKKSAAFRIDLHVRPFSCSA